LLSVLCYFSICCQQQQQQQLLNENLLRFHMTIKDNAAPAVVDVTTITRASRGQEQVTREISVDAHMQYGKEIVIEKIDE